MRLFKRRAAKLPIVERRSQDSENMERRKVFDEHDKKTVEMKQVHVENQVAETDRRLEAIKANLRAIQRKGIREG